MSSILTNSPFTQLRPENSTKTKPTELYFPGLYLDQKEIEEEKKKFSEFIDNTIEGQEYRKSSTLDDFQNNQFQSYYENKEDFFRASTGIGSNKINDVLEGWRVDRTDTPMLSITVAGPEVTVFQPKKLAKGTWQNADEFTFAGGSTWGLLLDKEASSPQFTELLGRNAQANHYAAVRARGGKRGELWKNATAKSTWLADMLTEQDTVKKELDSWIESTPTALSIKGSIPFSAYFGNTMLDVLKKSEENIPEDWSTKKAIEELKQSDPGLANTLFVDMGVDEKTLEQLAKSPLQFKYFIADAIDTHAYQTYLSEYTQAAGFWEESYAVYAWPLIRDSFNSNDTFSELMVTGGALALTATGVGAYVGIPILAGKALEKISHITKGAKRTFDVIESVSKRSGQIAKLNKVIWKTQHYLPSRITETVFKATGLEKKLFSVPEKAGRLRKILVGGTEQFVGEFSQGLLESGVQQYEAMSTEFQQHYSIKDMFANGLEEGIGGLVLGGPMRAISKGSEKLMTTRLGERINTFIDSTKTRLSNSVPVSPKTEMVLDAATRLIAGIPDNVTTEEFTGGIERRLRLKNTLIEVEEVTGIKGILEGAVNEDELLEAAVLALSQGDPKRNFNARVEILKRMEALVDKTRDPVTGKSTLSKKSAEALLFLTAMDAVGNDETQVNKIHEALWLSRKRQEGITSKDGKPLSIKDATEEEIKQLSDEMAEETTLLATKLGAKNADEVSKLFGSSLSDDDIKEINNSVNEHEEDQINSGSSEKETIDFPVPTEGMIKDTIDPEKRKQEIEQQKIKEENKKEAEKTKDQSTKFEVAADTLISASKEKETTGKLSPETETSILSIVDGLLEDKEVDENVELTPEEKENLLKRVCTRKGV